MKRILFIETEEDYSTSLDFLNQHPDKKEGLLVVKLNVNLEVTYPEDAGITCRGESDYISKRLLAGINEFAIGLGTSWFKDESLKDSLSCESINIGLVIEHYFIRAIITACKYLRLIRHIIKKEDCREIIIVEKSPANIKSITPLDDEKITNGIIDIIKMSEGLNVQLLKQYRQTPQRQKGISSVRSMAYSLFDLLRRLSNEVIDKRNKGRKTAVLFGAPRLVFPTLEGLGRVGYKTVYFQYEIGPRMVFRLWRRGAAYKTAADYRISSEDIELERIKAKLRAKYKALCELDYLKKNFRFDNTDISLMLIERLQFAYEEFIPDIVIRVRKFKAFLKDEMADVLIVDESMKEVGRPLVLAADMLGIRSLEILHGTYAYFKDINFITTKVAMPGDYFKDAFAEEGLISKGRIVVTGNPQWDSLVAMDRASDIEEVKRRFRIDEKDRIIVYTPHPFKRGSKGGILNVHATMDEIRDMLNSVLNSLKGIKDVHLILKLHHNDIHRGYTYRIIRENGYKGPYSVVHIYNIYKLLNSADIVISPMSTAVFEALLLHRPVVYLDYTGSEYHLPFVEYGSLKGAFTPGELKRQIEGILNDTKRYYSETDTGRDRALKEMANGADGSSSDRIISAVEELINN